MPDQLRFILEPLPHPYPQSSGAELEAWGHLSIYILTDMSRQLLLKMQWNLDALAEWFCEHSSDLCQSYRETEEQQSLQGESLAQRNWRLRQRFDYLTGEITDAQIHEIDQWETQLSASSGHTLNSMLPGASAPPIVLGCHNQNGEISFVPEAANNIYESAGEFILAPGSWFFTFDMADFVARLRASLILFLRTWIQEPPSPFIRNRAEQLLIRLYNLQEQKVSCCQPV